MVEEKMLLKEFDELELTNWSKNKVLINIVKNHIKTISQKRAEIIIKILLRKMSYTDSKFSFEISDKTIGTDIVKLRKENSKGIIEVNNVLCFTDDFLKPICDEIKKIIMNIGEQNIDESFDSIDEKTGEKIFNVKKGWMFKQIDKMICDDDNIKFKYDFNNPDMECSYIDETNQTLQRVKINIINKIWEINYFTEYKYYCPTCQSDYSYKKYEVESKKGITCTGYRNRINPDGEEKIERCGGILYPIMSNSELIKMHLYNISYIDYNNRINHGIGMSFNELTCGHYDSVLFISSATTMENSFIIIDVKKEESVKFQFPQFNENENYLITLQKSIDEFIKKQTGVVIHGLYPIKIAMLIQTIVQAMSFPLDYHIKLTGQPGTGKTMALRYYNSFLHNDRYLAANAMNISLASLRGTPEKIIIGGKEYGYISKGYYGFYNAIHIEEAMMNKDIIISLKADLLEGTYAYYKANSTGSPHNRTAHINISENFDNKHRTLFRKKVKEAYTNMTVEINKIKKPAWDDSWILEYQLFYYSDNIYLLSAIKQIRRYFESLEIHWLDGYQMAIIQRFPFNFYMTKDSENTLIKTVIANSHTIVKYSRNIDLINALRCEGFNEYLASLKDTTEIENQNEEISNGIKNICEEFKIEEETRIITFYAMVLRISAIVNKRANIMKQDFDILRWLVSKMNYMIPVGELASYEPTIYVNVDIDSNIKEQLDNTEKTKFGLDDDEFNGEPKI